MGCLEKRVAQLSVVLLSVLGMLGSPANAVQVEDAAPGTITEVVCQDPMIGPRHLLLDIADLPVIPLEPPPKKAWPAVSLSTIWFLEIGFTLLLAAAAGGFAVHLFRSQTPPLLPLLLAATALLFIVLAADDVFAGRRFTTALEMAKGSWEVGEHDNADAWLLRAQKTGSKVMVGRWVPVYRSALERPDLEELRRINGITAVHQAISAQDPDALGHVLSYFDANTPSAVQASVAALSHRGRLLLDRGETAEALATARHADRFGIADLRPYDNLCATLYHHAVALAATGQPRQAAGLAQELETPACNLKAFDRTVLHGWVARGFSQEYLDVANPEKLNTTAAVAEHRRVYDYGRQSQLSLPFMTCDYVAALDAHALLSLDREEPAPAVEALDVTEELLPGRPFVRSTLPAALYSLGNQHLAAEDFEPAVAAMKRGYTYTEGQNPMLVEGLSRAYLARGAKEVESRQFDNAVGSFTEGYRVNPGNPEIRTALADSLLVRGDESLKSADLGAARADFEQASQVSRRHRRTAGMRLQILEETPRRLEALRHKPDWLGVPYFVGEVPRDANNDGILEGVVYYGEDPTRPLALGELTSPGSEPNHLLLLDDEQKTTVMLRDHDGDGRLDERTTYSGPAINGMIVDIDHDVRPDVQVSFRDGEEFLRTPLSGKLLMVMREGVVGDMWMDIFSQADAYVKLFQNYELKFVSDTVTDSNFPIWNQGVVVHYRHGDRLQLELWDRDVISNDDLIDVYRTNALPSSDVYSFQNRKAAIRMSVTPSELPEGHVMYFDAPEAEGHYFLDHEATVEEYKDLIDMARADAVRAEVMRFLAEETVELAIDASPVSPMERFVLKVIAGIAMDLTM